MAQLKEDDVQRAADGSPIPMNALPVRKVDLKALVDITRPLETKKLTAKGMFYGDAGTMKTTQAMRFAQAITDPEKHILYLDSAEGWSTLMNYREEGLMNRVLHQPVDSQEQLIAVIGAVRMQQAPFNKIGCIIFDEYTQMVDNDLNWIVESRSEQAAKDGGYKDPFTPALPDYNATRIRSNKVLAAALKLPDAHLLFIGHEKTDKARIIPDMQDKAGKSLYQRLHFLYHLEQYTPKDKDAETYWRMQTVNGNRIVAKNRIVNVPAFVRDINVLIDCYQKWGVKTNDGKVLKPEPVKVDPASNPEATEDDLVAILEGKKK